MANGGKRANGGGERQMRPLFLAGVLGLAWFALMQDGAIDADVPTWAVPVTVGTRLLADIVGGWVVVSLLRIVIAVLRLVGQAGWMKMSSVVARVGKE